MGGGPGWQPLGDTIIVALQTSTRQKERTVFLGLKGTPPWVLVPAISGSIKTLEGRLQVLGTCLNRFQSLSLDALSLFPPFFSDVKIALPLRVYKGLSKLTAVMSEMGQALKGMRSCGLRIMWGDSESWAEPRNLHFIQPRGEI